MGAGFVNLTAENIDQEHLCCIICSKKVHPGIEAKRQWLSNQTFAKKFGFEVVDTTDYGYELLVLSFDGTVPTFTEKAKKGAFYKGQFETVNLLDNTALQKMLRK